jgi:uncharacterized protein YccT (UPF0319 family)
VICIFYFLVSFHDVNNAETTRTTDKRDIFFSVENSFSLENDMQRYNQDGDNASSPLPPCVLAVMMMQVPVQAVSHPEGAETEG